MADAVTPTRKILRKSVQKRLKTEPESLKVAEDVLGILEELSQKVSKKYGSLESRIIFSETKLNHVEPLLEISMKTKRYDRETGPVYAIRVVFNGKLEFKVYVYLEVLETGTLLNRDTDEAVNLLIFTKMNDKSYFVCTGIGDYSSFKEGIDYVPKVVMNVSLPSDTVHHIDCTRICSKINGQKLLTCQHCRSLKVHLVRQKRKCSVDGRHSDHQQSSSTFPFDYLSPASKKTKLTLVRKENKKLKIMNSRLRGHNDNFCLELNNEQSNEMSKLVHEISSSKTGQSELENIFNEAEEFGEESSEILRGIWENDTSDIALFDKDQHSNGT